MNDLLERFFHKHNLNWINKTFVIAVSTGVDSSVLLDLFLKVKDKCHIIVAHVNHHKREQSEEEEKYIKAFCEENKIELYIKELFFENCQNFQAEARKLRYDFFDQIMSEVHGDYLVLAHHGDDNIETILMRLIRGSSLIGYGGIKEVFEKKDNVNEENNYMIIRPLLTKSKDEIIKYQKMHNIKYYEDYSNHEKSYTRNRLRLDVIPMLKEESSDLIEKISEFSETIENAGIIVNAKRDEFINKYVLWDKNKTNEIVINRSEYLKESPFMKREILFELVKKDSLSKANIDELIKIIESKKQNYKTYFKGIFDFILSYDKVLINYNHVEIKETNKDFNVEITGIGTFVINDNYQIIVSKNSSNGLCKNDELCYNSVDLPIIVRNRHNGDRIKLPNGEKKVKDILIDLKIPQVDRDNIIIIEKDEKILSIFGIKKSTYLTNIKNCDIIIKLEKVK